MSCKEIWEKYEENLNSQELLKHIEECADCKERFELEMLIKKGIKRLKVKRVPSSLWVNIENRLIKEKERKRRLLSRVFRRIKEKKLKPFLKPALGFVFVFIMLFFSYKLFFIENKKREKLSRLQAEVILEIKKAEDHYLNAIEKLTVLANENRKNIEPELLMVYREKLALLDESIAECKRILQENEFNINAQRFLFTAYQKKINTLREMAE